MGEFIRISIGDGEVIYTEMGEFIRISIGDGRGNFVKKGVA